MPFTVSHLAAILPLRRGGLVPSALAIGAMAPDVPLFAPVSSRGESHSAVGLVSVSLLFACVLFVLFHGLFKEPVLALAPAYLRRRLSGPARYRGPRNVVDVLWVVGSFLVGEVTHVLWDAFTHRTGPGVKAFPVLAETVGGGLPFYRYAQYGSGVFGLVVLAVWCTLWLRRAETVSDPIPAASTRTRLLVAVSASVAGFAGAAHGVLARGDTGQVAHAVVGLMVGVSVCAFGYALFQVRWVRRRP